MNTALLSTLGLAVITGVLVTARIDSGAQTAQAPEHVRLIESIQGPALYKAYCAVCHGATLKGDGPMAKLIKDPTPDLTRLATHNGGKFPRMEVEKIIYGEEVRPGHGTREMPVWGPIFSQIGWEDRDLGRVRVDNLARYIEEMQVK